MPNPIDSVERASCFYAMFRKHLVSIGIKTPTHIQASMWPLVLRGKPVTCISSPGSGKTTGFLVPMLNCLLKPYFESLPVDNKIPKPYFVVLCCSAKKVIQTVELAKKLRATQAIRVCSLQGSITTKDERIQISKGVDLLIATPTSYANALDHQV